MALKHKYEIAQLLKAVPDTTIWGIAIKRALRNKHKVHSLILQLQSQAKDNVEMMSSILGESLTEKILNYTCSGKYKDLTGQKFTRLTVLRRTGKKRGTQIEWLCRCDCGNEKIAITRALTSKHTRSCGCLPTHHVKHGATNTRFYKIWKDMKIRSRPNKWQPPSYARKNITMCERWNDFHNFYSDMFPTYREDLTLDRIDNCGNYEPGNCRWATIAEQQQNKETNTFFTIGGKTMTMSEWCRGYNINISTVRARLKKGMDIEQALIKPPAPRYTNGFLATRN
jgi:hypothetical protein